VKQVEIGDPFAQFAFGRFQAISHLLRFHVQQPVIAGDR
jgi:hypothetical protein